VRPVVDAGRDRFLEDREAGLGLGHGGREAGEKSLVCVLSDEGHTPRGKNADDFFRRDRGFGFRHDEVDQVVDIGKALAVVFSGRRSTVPARWCDGRPSGQHGIAIPKQHIDQAVRFRPCRQSADVVWFEHDHETRVEAGQFDQSVEIPRRGEFDEHANRSQGCRRNCSLGKNCSHDEPYPDESCQSYPPVDEDSRLHVRIPKHSHSPPILKKAGTSFSHKTARSRHGVDKDQKRGQLCQPVPATVLDPFLNHARKRNPNGPVTQC